MNSMPLRMLMLCVPLLIGACSGGGPDAVAGDFWDKVRAGDEAGAKALLTKQSRAGFKLERDSPGREGEVRLGKASAQDGIATVSTTLVGAGDHATELAMSTVLVLEDGEWRVDWNQTLGSMLGGIMGELMKGMAEAADQMSKAMQKSMQQGTQQK